MADGLTQMSAENFAKEPASWVLQLRRCGVLWDHMCIKWGFSGGSVDKESACNARDLGSILGLGSSSREGNGNPLQYSCGENLMDRGA